MELHSQIFKIDLIDVSFLFWLLTTSNFQSPLAWVLLCKIRWWWVHRVYQSRIRWKYKSIAKHWWSLRRTLSQRRCLQTQSRILQRAVVQVAAFLVETSSLKNWVFLRHAAWGRWSQYCPLHLQCFLLIWIPSQLGAIPRSALDTVSTRRDKSSIACSNRSYTEKVQTCQYLRVRHVWIQNQI